MFQSQKFKKNRSKTEISDFNFTDIELQSCSCKPRSFTSVYFCLIIFFSFYDSNIFPVKKCHFNEFVSGPYKAIGNT
jgi:hypothetical protein